MRRRSITIGAWGMLYLGMAFLCLGGLLADPDVAFGQITPPECDRLANEIADPQTSVIHRCLCVCRKRYPLGDDRTRCGIACADTTNFCAGDAKCNPGLTGQGSITMVCTTAGLSINVSCKGRCDGGNLCGGCACQVVPSTDGGAQQCKCDINPNVLPAVADATVAR